MDNGFDESYPFVYIGHVWSANNYSKHEKKRSVQCHNAAKSWQIQKEKRKDKLEKIETD